MITWHDITQQLAHSESTQLIAKIFGPWVYTVVGLTPPQSDGQTIVTVYAGQLVNIAWIMFLILIVYMALTSGMNAAREGSWAKREWSGMWGVVRLVISVAAITPTKASGVIGACWVVMWLGLTASGIADIFWGNILNAMGNDSLNAQAQKIEQAFDQVSTQQILDREFSYIQCSVNKITAANDPNVTVDNFNPIKPSDNPVAQKIAKFCSGDKYQTYLNLTNDAPAPKAPSGNELDGGQLAAYEKAQFDYIIRQRALSYIKDKNKGVFGFYYTHLNDFQSGNITASDSAIWKSLKEEFYNQISADLKNAVKQDHALESQYAKNVSRYGWVSAGNYYVQLAGEEDAVSYAINSAIENSPNYVSPQDEKAFSDADAISDVNSITALSWLDSNSDNSQNTEDDKKQNNDKFKTYLLKPDDTQDPILAMSRFGHALESSMTATFIGREFISIFSEIPGLGFIDKAVNNTAVQTTNMVLAAIGTILGTVIPVLPTIFFAFCVISWFIYLLQMFIVAPFWMVANSTQEGDGFSSTHARKGFNNALFVVGFPVFAIGGLAAAIMVSRLGMWIINAIFYQQFQAMTGSMSVPLSFIGLCALYAMCAWSVITNSMSLVQTVPRTLLDWLSLSEPGMHPFNSAGMEIQDKAISGTNQLVRTGVGTAGNMLAPVSASVSGALSHNKQNFESFAKERQAKKQDHNNDSSESNKGN